MSLLSLVDQVLYPTDSSGLLGNPMMGAFGTAMIGILVLYILSILALYFYTSFAFMAIGRKAQLKSPGVAWVTPLATLFEVSNMHWWPIPATFIGFILSYLLIVGGAFSSLALSILGGILIMITMIFGAVILIMWHWKTFEAIGKPGWWILIPVILAIIGFLCTLAVVVLPLLVIIGFLLFFIAAVTYLILIGIAAWSK